MHVPRFFSEYVSGACGRCRIVPGPRDLLEDTPHNPDPAADAAAPVHRTTVHIHDPATVVFHEAAGRDDGRWFMMLRSLVRSGRWAALLDRHRTVLVVLAELRDHRTGIATAPFDKFRRPEDGSICPGLLALTGQSRSTLYLSLAELCADPTALIAEPPCSHGKARAWKPHEIRAFRAAAGLLAERGRDQYAVFPGVIFAGRAKPASDGGESRMPDEPAEKVPHAGRLSSTPDAQFQERIKNQTSQERVEDEPALERAGSFPGWPGSMPKTRGWPGFGLFWNLDDCTDVTEALGKLGVNPPLLHLTASLARLSVEEIALAAATIRNDPTIHNPATVLCHRLFSARGLKVPAELSKASLIKKQYGPEWAELILAQQKTTRDRVARFATAAAKESP